VAEWSTSLDAWESTPSPPLLQAPRLPLSNADPPCCHPRVNSWTTGGGAWPLNAASVATSSLLPQGEKKQLPDENVLACEVGVADVLLSPWQPRSGTPQHPPQAGIAVAGNNGGRMAREPPCAPLVRAKRLPISTTSCVIRTCSDCRESCALWTSTSVSRMASRPCFPSC